MTPPRSQLVLNHVPEAVDIPIGLTHSVPGTLALPPHPVGLVLFAHGSGSSRLSPRNRYVADRLFAANLGCLLFDLLTDRESRSRDNVFDIPLLAERLQLATQWAAGYPATRDLVPGYFGASTGAAAALMAAAGTTRVRAVVSRGGRPDLAGDWLRQVTAPTLLIVGSADPTVLELNAHALEQLGGIRELIVVPRATHLFEEPGTLERVAEEAASWFSRYLPAGAEELQPSVTGIRA
jgi:pimeloyl-ACP methyl ester carboxylesterase